MDPIEPRIDSITYTMRRGPERKKPQAGDERYLKGRGVWQVRQQQRMSVGPHAGMMLISNGRPVWEWVDKGSDSDRERDSSKRKAQEPPADYAALEAMFRPAKTQLLDLHKLTAAAILKVKYDDVTPAQRANSKAKLYMLLYSPTAQWSAPDNEVLLAVYTEEQVEELCSVLNTTRDNLSVAITDMFGAPNESQSSHP